MAARLKGDLAGDGAATADLVIEAIIENPEAKRELYAQVEPRMKPDALLTTNTSSIPLTELREHIQRPAQFAGLHYFNPVALMPLVEIIRHDAMAPETEQRLAGVLQGDRQAAGAGRRHAGLPGQPRAVPVHAGSGRPRSPKAFPARRSTRRR